MKKNCLLIIFILALGIKLVTAQDFDTIQKISLKYSDLRMQIYNDWQAGKITLEDYGKKTAELTAQQQTEIDRAMQKKDDNAEVFTQAQMDRLLLLYEQRKLIELEFNEGRMSGPEYGKRAEPLTKEIEQFGDSIRNSIEKASQVGSVASVINARWPGTHAGWPKPEGENRYLTVTGIGPFRQGTGTRPSYSILHRFMDDEPIYYTLYQTGATARTLSDLKQQIETVMGQPMVAKDSPDTYNTWRPILKHDDYGWSGWDVDLKLRGDTLSLEIEWAFDGSE